MAEKIIKFGIWLLIVPVIILLGVFVFGDKQYAFISVAVALFACVPVFVSFEKRDRKVTELVVIAVMVALSVLGRFIFAAVPAFKPVTAIVVITAMYLGPEAGFVTGALTAFISNFYFGQGPWTPFQMFVWGLLGMIAGLLADPLKRHMIVLIIYGIFAGIIFSLLMDVWTVLWWDGTFNLERYLAAIISAVPFTAIYAVSNAVFLLLLGKPLGKKLERVKEKYI